MIDTLVVEDETLLHTFIGSDGRGRGAGKEHGNRVVHQKASLLAFGTIFVRVNAFQTTFITFQALVFVIIIHLHR